MSRKNGGTRKPGPRFEYIGYMRIRPSTMAAIFAAFAADGYDTKKSLSTTSSQGRRKTSTTLITSNRHTGTVITSKARSDGRPKLVATSRRSLDY